MGEEGVELKGEGRERRVHLISTCVSPAAMRENL